jgi:Cu+-exporting ATPase
MMTDIIPKQNRLHGKDHKVIYIDPVCGMSTDEPDTYQALEHGERTYYFCSDHCLTKFKADPEGFISGKKQQEIDEEPIAGQQYPRNSPGSSWFMS